MSVAGGGVSGECPQALVSADAHSWLTGYYPTKTSGDRQCRQPCQGIKGRLGHWSSFLCEQFSRRYLEKKVNNPKKASIVFIGGGKNHKPQPPVFETWEWGRRGRLRSESRKGLGC